MLFTLVVANFGAFDVLCLAALVLLGCARVLMFREPLLGSAGGGETFIVVLFTNIGFEQGDT